MRVDRNCNRCTRRVAKDGMRLVAMAVVFLTLSLARAQTIADPFAEPLPDEVSAVFALAGLDESQQARMTAPQRGYPRQPAPEDTLGAKLRNFYSGALASLKGSRESGIERASLTIVPEAPLLSETRDLDLTYTIRNTGRQMTRLEFPTSQRLEIVTRTSSGTVVERWSDDRVFQAGEGLVVINPDERIEFQEKVPTRDMRAGAAYTVEASLAAEPNFAIEQTIQTR